MHLLMTIMQCEINSRVRLIFSICLIFGVCVASSVCKGADEVFVLCLFPTVTPIHVFPLFSASLVLLQA